jgi:hypothetical protein
VTIGWLLEALDSGKLPRPSRVTPIEAATNTLRLSLQEIPSSVDHACPPLRTNITRRLDKGESIRIHTGRVTVTATVPGRRLLSQPLTFGASDITWFHDHVLVDVAGPLTLHIAPIGSGVTIC